MRGRTRRTEGGAYMTMPAEFTTFLFRGNVVDLAVAVVLGFASIAAAVFFFVVKPMNYPQSHLAEEEPDTKECPIDIPIKGRRCPESHGAAGHGLERTRRGRPGNRAGNGRRPGPYSPAARRLLAGGKDGDDAATAAARELDGAGRLGEDRVVAADPGSVAGLEHGSALAHDDLAAGDGLAGEHLDAESLGVGVAAVAARAEAFLMSHCRPPWSGRPVPRPPQSCPAPPARPPRQLRASASPRPRWQRQSPGRPARPTSRPPRPPARCRSPRRAQPPPAPGSSSPRRTTSSPSRR